jgi:hypothetical protein
MALDHPLRDLNARLRPQHQRNGRREAVADAALHPFDPGHRRQITVVRRHGIPLLQRGRVLPDLHGLHGGTEPGRNLGRPPQRCARLR